MGWGTYLITPMYFSKENYKTKYDVEKSLNEIREIIENYKMRLFQFATMTDPKKFCPDDYASPLQWIEEEMSEIFRELEFAYTDEYKLTILLDAWDRCHNSEGKAIVPNEPLKIWDMDYCGGDFIDEVYPDGTPVNKEIE